MHQYWKLFCKRWNRGFNGKIVQVLTRPSKEYRQSVADSQVRDLDAVIQKLNTTFQQELKDEVEAFNFFLQ